MRATTIDRAEERAAARAAVPADTPPRLRVLHLIVNLNEMSAQYNEHCLPLAAERDITICCFSKPMVQVPAEIRLFSGGGSWGGFLRALDSALAHGPYDVVHAHAPRTAFPLMAAAFRRRLSLRNGVYTVHNSFGSFRLRSQVLLFPVAASFPAIVFCSRSALGSIPRALRRLVDGKVTVVQNGVDTSRVRRTLGDQPPPRGPDFTVASVGRLIPRKDPLAVVRAFGAAFDGGERLTFIGDGEMRQPVAEHGRALGLGARLTITGMVPRETVYHLVASSDVVISASRGEGLPVGVLEAMACATPVILSDIPPHREVAEGVREVPLVKVGDVDGFARELRRLRTMPADERESIGRVCQLTAERRFSLTAMQRGYDAVYARVGTAAGSRAVRNNALSNGVPTGPVMQST